MSHIEKEKLIKADIRSIENRVRHAFYQGYDLGFKDGKGKTDYETRLKADMVAMLIELQNKINAIPINPDNSEAFRLGQATAYDKSEDVIQQKINELKGEEECS